jgi:hypothetical protein
LDDDHNVKKDRAELTRDPLAPQQPSPTEHSLTQVPTHTDPAQTKAAELEIEGPEIELGALIL